MKTWFALLVAALLLASCGVRGLPQPPQTPAELGRGQPTFKRTGDDYTFPTPTPAAAPGASAPESKK